MIRDYCKSVCSWGTVDGLLTSECVQQAACPCVGCGRKSTCSLWHSTFPAAILKTVSPFKPYSLVLFRGKRCLSNTLSPSYGPNVDNRGDCFIVVLLCFHSRGWLFRHALSSMHYNKSWHAHRQDYMLLLSLNTPDKTFKEETKHLFAQPCPIASPFAFLWVYHVCCTFYVNGQQSLVG